MLTNFLFVTFFHKLSFCFAHNASEHDPAVEIDSFYKDLPQGNIGFRQRERKSPPFHAYHPTFAVNDLEFMMILILILILNIRFQCDTSIGRQGPGAANWFV